MTHLKQPTTGQKMGLMHKARKLLADRHEEEYEKLLRACYDTEGYVYTPPKERMTPREKAIEHMKRVAAKHGIPFDPASVPESDSDTPLIPTPAELVAEQQQRYQVQPNLEHPGPRGRERTYAPTDFGGSVDDDAELDEDAATELRKRGRGTAL